MAEQNYANHRRTVPPFHFFLLPLLLAVFIGSIVNVTSSSSDHALAVYSSALLIALSVGAAMTAVFARLFANRAQDRAIRAEENLRHFVLTGKLLDPRLSVPQIVALRFASDGEFVVLGARAAQENLQPNDIKQAVKQWREDNYRV
jgi:hypothetical protein